MSSIALGVELGELDLGALAEAALDRLAVEVPLGVDAHVDAPAGHPGAGPGADVAEHDGAARGHVLEREALRVGAVDDAAARVVERLRRLAAEHDVGAREADAEARVGRALDEQAAALGAVGERLADRAVDALARRALPFRIETVPPSIVLPTPSWAPPSTRTTTPVGVEGAEALAGDRAAVEVELGEHVLGALGRVAVDPRRGRSRPASSVPSTRSLASVGRGNSCRTRVAARRPRRRAPRSAAEACFGSIRIGRARTRPASARASTMLLLGDRQVDRLEVEVLLERRDQLGEVDAVGVRDLLEQVVAADQVLGALVAELGDDAP